MSPGASPEPTPGRRTRVIAVAGVAAGLALTAGAYFFGEGARSDASEQVVIPVVNVARDSGDMVVPPAQSPATTTVGPASSPSSSSTATGAPASPTGSAPTGEGATPTRPGVIVTPTLDGSGTTPTVPGGPDTTPSPIGDDSSITPAAS